MASNTYSSPLFTAALVLVLLLNLISDVHSRQSPTKEPSSPFDFLKHLQGCHKGDKIKGIHDLKLYLEKFGYLQYPFPENHSHANDDDFDDLLEAAVKTYQLNYNLKVTGSLDKETVSEMTKPRCGVADIINGTTRMHSGNAQGHPHHSHSSLHTTKLFSFFPGNPKWPPTKYQLTYSFQQGTPLKAFAPVARAFATWAGNTHFRFSQVQGHSDITIAFHRRDHGDGAPFDGPGGTIAHAFAPTNGRFHYDGDESYAVGAVPRAYDLETVALHEIGHLLGLHHSSVDGAIMFPSIAQGVTKGLHQDDIQGIKTLYNM